MSTTASRRIQSYPNAILRWKLNEGATASGAISFANTGSYSGHAMTIGSAQSSAVTTGFPAVIERGCRFNGAKTTQRTYLATANPTQVPSVSVQMFSLSCWIIIRQYNATTSQPVFAKDRNTSLTNAHAADTVGLQVGTTGTLRVVVTTGTPGSGVQTIAVSTTVMREDVPYLIAGTYDGVNIRGFINGQLVVTAAKTGNLDWGTDNSNLGGPWYIGGARSTNVAQDSQVFDGIVEECVAETALISESMMLDRYRKGMGLSVLSAA